MASLLELQPLTPTPPSSSFETYTTPSFDTASLASDSDIESDDDEDVTPPSLRQPSAKHCGFTPYRGIGRLPRAWERKAATPYAPRSDGQRIWKRVPLAETQSRNVSAAEGHSDDTVKIVKKMKMGMSQEGNTPLAAEGIVVETKIETLEELGDVKRKISGTLALTESNTSAQIIEESTTTTTVYDATDDERAQVLETTPQNRNAALSSSPNSVPSNETEEGESARTREMTNEHQQVDKDQEYRKPIPSPEISPDVTAQQNFSIVDEDLFNLSKHDNSNVSMFDTTHTMSSGEGDDENFAEAATSEDNDLNANDDGPSRAAALVDSLKSEALCRSERRRSSFFSVFTGQGILQTSEEVAHESTSQETLSQVAASPNDDTAFLHAFLSRSRAQKAVRAQSCPEKSSIGKVEADDNGVLATIDDTKSAVMETEDNLDLDPNDTEANITSPCRRSSRTRLSRPQKMVPALPSSIPVRRSNGTEFIFLQKSESQEVAIATRVNTRRNKGDAQPPRLKLPHLRDPNYVNNMNSMATKSSPKRRKRKEVSWNEAQLTEMYEIALAEPAAVQNEEEDQTETVAADTVVIKASARKLRKLGTVNGTPAPKRMMMDEAEDLRGPERRLRSRARQ